MEKGLFYLPCGNNVDDLPPHLRDGITPIKDGTDGMHPLFNEETYDKICAYYGDEKTNTKESIDDLKEFMDKETNKSSYSVSMEGQLYDFGSCYLCWGNENDE